MKDMPHKKMHKEMMEKPNPNQSGSAPSGKKKPSTGTSKANPAKPE